MSGFIYLCGPSGAGKDSLLQLARRQLSGHPRIVFAPRVMTRPSDHDSSGGTLTAEDFAALEARGELCLAWSAHGYRYGIERSAVDWVEQGRWVVVSGSREWAWLARSMFPETKVVLVTAPEPVLSRRLHARRRESAEAIAERERRNRLYSELKADLVIVNDGDLEQSCRQLVLGLRRWLEQG